MNGTDNFDFPGIYQIQNIRNGKKYVGQARNIAVRIIEHRRRRNDGYLYRAIHKAGWLNFEISVLERIDDLSLLDVREQYWIDRLDCCNPCKGYNTCKTARSWSGIKHTPEAREKMRNAGRLRLGEKNPFYGKQHTDEAKKRMSEKHRGIPLKPEHRVKLTQSRRERDSYRVLRKAVLQIDAVSGEVIARYDSVTGASRATGTSIPGISSVCTGARRIAGGFKWQFAQASPDTF